MKRRLLILCLIVMSITLANAQTTNSWIRINQLGYLPKDIKVAVLISTEEITSDLSFRGSSGQPPVLPATQHGTPNFSLIDAKTGKTVFSGQGKIADAAYWGLKSAFRLDFSSVQIEGDYYIEVAEVKSPQFKIGADIYEGSVDFMLDYMRRQRCGHNNFLGTVCHQHDGYIVEHPTRTGERIDVRGGWHDADDKLQYVTTTASAIYHMMLAYYQAKDKTIFKDNYRADASPGSNGIPDILDEIRWGLDWLSRMNPAPKEMYNQIADDRDHAGYGLPQNDNVDYGWGPGKGRPVYFITGEPQDLPNPKTGEIQLNRTTGVASTAGKFASCFALGAELFKNVDPAFAKALSGKAEPAYEFALEHPGNTQTVCVVSPYFYEEDNYVDDIELAAATFYTLTKDPKWRTEGDYWGQLEPVNPLWAFGFARHYQFYPFVNQGHHLMAKSEDAVTSKKFTDFMRQGLQTIRNRAGNEPFMNGVPYVWCANFAVIGAASYAHQYKEISGDNSFEEMEAALRDWILGCNPWGFSFIGGFPKGGVSSRMDDARLGGLVDGPIDEGWHDTFMGIPKVSRSKDPLAAFQNGPAVFHKDSYGTNEPVIDGTCYMMYYLSMMEQLGKEQSGKSNNTVTDAYGATVKFDTDSKVVHLVFSADSAFEGATTILRALDKHNAKASFFLTGNCLRMKEHEPVIKEIIRKKHYVGGHSGKHLLYAPWDKREESLVSTDSLISDFNQNMRELERFGIDISKVKYYLPPYEWYNKQSVELVERLGQYTINYTPGIRTAADYTTPDMKNYHSSQELIDSLYEYESKNGLNGCIILIHPGTHKDRTDKLYNRLDEILKHLKNKGYQFKHL
ncbi:MULTISPECIES: glycoside hydrolase family 9 protein [unclassified Dysgonomonas]|uniref:glycoside hydrolase family 9 protein n=1 Tax=unclassified Dysgonomonas TaxID=2630389 RepID=UPI0025B9C163|nr:MULTISPECIES: glycoside hydrolase family 9 protein [unclassified Dysgonomonas]MDR2002022.1 glycoside hydrolase family 9 protein [Prevotella sp.]HMM02771.1 glycoside hydrolase family 9 protein [Dysgonomonas sp.]